MLPKHGSVGIHAMTVYPEWCALVEIIAAGAIVGKRGVAVGIDEFAYLLFQSRRMKHKRLLPQLAVVIERQVLVGVVHMFLAGGNSQACKQQNEEASECRVQHALRLIDRELTCHIAYFNKVDALAEETQVAMEVGAVHTHGLDTLARKIIDVEHLAGSSRHAHVVASRNNDDVALVYINQFDGCRCLCCLGTTQKKG